MKIGIATDHNGVNEKKEIITYLERNGYEVIDFSPINNPLDNYPEYALKVSQGVINKEVDLGVLMCGTGIGMSIAANKVKGIRCAKVSNIEEAKLAREHNNANIIALSYKEELNKLIEMIDNFVKTTFLEEERHVKRIAMIKEMEENND